MSKEQFLINFPVSFKGRFQIYPPLVKEIIGTPNSQIYIKLLTQSQEDIEDEIAEKNKEAKDFPTPLQFILKNCEENQAYEKLYKEAFQFFLHEEVNFLTDLQLIVIGNLNDIISNSSQLNNLKYINESDFLEFQNLIRESVGEKIVEPPNPNEHPKVREMKRKARYRDRVKKKQQEKKGEGISFFSMLVSICCMGLGITPLNIGEMSYVAIKAILTKYQEKEKYQLDIDSLLAGADSKKVNPKYWIKNLDE